MRDCCDHCELPLGGRVVASEIDGEALRFCCYGCLLAHQVTRASGDEGAASSVVIRLGLAIFLGMNVMVMSVPGYAPYLYGGDAAAFEGPLSLVLRWLAMCFGLPVLVLLGWPILRSFVAGGWAGAAKADALVLLGASSAFGLSVYRTITGAPEVYFDTAVMVLLFVTLGRYLEARARADAGRAIRADLIAAPERATRIVGHEMTPVDVSELAAGDVVRVVAGEMFPTDGVVLEGSGWVDEALMTGESRMVLRSPGSAIAGGTCSVDGCFEVRVERPATLSAAARIEGLLESARRTSSPMERMADGYARVFLPLTVIIAAVSCVWHAFNQSIDAGILAGLSVLVVACPCALGIATPVALWFGVVAAARRGIILRDASVLERGNRVDRVFFDKTGTLSERTPRLVGCELSPDCPWSAAELLERVAALERGQRHPIARAMVAVVAGERLGGIRVSEVVVEPGRGIRGRVDGVPLFAGSGGRREGDAAGEVVVRSDGRLLGVLRFCEDLRQDASAAFVELRDDLAVAVGVLSGDSSAESLADVAADDLVVEVGLSPDEKLEHVRAASVAARKCGAAVAFVGDGVNDAPALAAAEVGVAFGDPADLPRSAADALCLNDQLRSIPWLLRHSRRVVRIVRQNLMVAFGYNLVAVGLAASGRLDPLVASVAMLGSSLLVVANARRAGSSRVRHELAPMPKAVVELPGPAQASWMPSSSSLR